MFKDERAERAASLLVLIGLFLLGVPQVAVAAAPLVRLAQPGPWSGISGLIGCGARLWFVNSVKFVDHNSADLYSYDPGTGTTRYERHLFSQDAGDPVVAAPLEQCLAPRPVETDDDFRADLDDGHAHLKHPAAVVYSRLQPGIDGLASVF